MPFTLALISKEPLRPVASNGILSWPWKCRPQTPCGSWARTVLSPQGLKQRIRTSSFPVEENLPDSKALAHWIGADLWELIEQQYPHLDWSDALEREQRQHASYRRWIDADYHAILITGESGSGKNALIANWMEAHYRGAHWRWTARDARETRSLAPAQAG